MKDKKITIQSIREIASQFYQFLNVADYVNAQNLLDNYVKQTGDTLNVSGCYIDLGSFTSQKDVIFKGINTYIEALSKNKNLTKEHRQSFNYNIGNGYLALFNIQKQIKESEYRAFIDNEYLLEATRYFLKSIKLGNDDPSIYTNYANLLDIQGRSLEAINFYDKAIRKNNTWGMAYGNKAISIIALARISGKYQTAQYILAYQLLKKAIECKDSVIEIGGIQALSEFEARITEIESLFSDKKNLLSNPFEHSKIETKSLSDKLKEYYKFSIENDLFLNLHIQDKECEAATIDHVFISLFTPIHDNDTFYRFAGWINEIKESYMTARYLLFESKIKSDDKSTISKLTDIVYPLDYSTKTLYTGLLKSSIKESFSILDKIAYFLNEYLDLEIRNKESINWQNVWFRDLKVNNPKHWFEDSCTFHHKIKNIENYSLFALFSLFLSIRDSKIADLRHQLTHKKILVKIEGSGNNIDEFTLDKLENSAVKLLHFTKYSIIYLINFVNSQENCKRKTGLVVPMYFITEQFI